MEYKKIPEGPEIPAIGLGTWHMGGGHSPDYSQDETVVQAVLTALDAGYRHIDTAEMYASGHTEELIRQALTQADIPREELILTSKVWHTNLKHNDVLKAAESSLKRLGTDYLDLYLIHWPNESVPLVDTFKALNKLVEEKTVRHVGVSNFNLRQLKKARELCSTPLAANQVPYSYTNRSYEDNGVLAYCQKNDILFTAYTPLEKGSLKNNAQLQRVADRHPADAIQVALAWLIHQPQIITIPMSKNPEHIRTNFEAANIQLTPEDLETLEKTG